MPNPTWASIIQNEEEVQGDIVFLPQPQTIQKGAGIFETILYKKEEDEITGSVKYLKATECSRTITVRRRISKLAKKRENVPKFGECFNQKVGETERGITDVCPEPVLFEWEHEKVDDDDDEVDVFSQFIKRPQQEILLSEIIPVHLRQDKSETAKPKRMADRYGRYGRRPDTTEMEDTPTIRLLDIPTNTQFHDLLDLVRVFHSLKIKLPRDHDYSDGSRNRGFAFITFSSHVDAERAKEALHGHAYGTNILHAEWSRNYANYMKAAPEVQAAHSSSGMGGFGGGRPRGRPRFTNSKKQNESNKIPGNAFKIPGNAFKIPK